LRKRVASASPLEGKIGFSRALRIEAEALVG
jgi:hypothetical protein